MREFQTFPIEDSEKKLIHSDLEYYLPLLDDTLMGDAESEKAVLLIHGFTGSNLEMLYLGNYLARNGYRVLIILLQGHGTNYQDLRKFGVENWRTKIKEMYRYLREEKTNRRIFLAGHSLGGTLALSVSHKLEITGLILMATPIKLPWYVRIYVNILGRTRARMYYAGFKFHNKDLYRNPLISFFNQRYEYIYYSSLREALTAMDFAQNTLGQIDVPLLLIYGMNDYRIPRNQVNLILCRVNSEIKEVNWIEKTDHILVIDSDHKKVADNLLNFCERLLEI